MLVDDFALMRGATESVRSKQTAERVWEPKFMARRDPRRERKPESTREVTVAEFLDRYYAEYVQAQGLKSIVTIQGQLEALKASLGQIAVVALEKPTDIARLKAE